MRALDKIRNLPIRTRKIILWSTVIVLGLILFFFWFKNLQNKLENFKKAEFKEKLNLPELEMPKIEIPEIEIPEISEEELKSLEEEIE